MITRRHLPFILLSLVTACAHAQFQPVVWPPPPEAPRIRFVTTMRSEADLDASNFGQVMRTLRGGDSRNVLASPMGLTLSEDGQRLYIAEVRVGRILVADFKEHHLSQFAADDPVPLPAGVALDKDENVYVTDSLGANVVVYSKNGKRLRSFGQDLVRPTGIALDKERRLVYVADSSKNEERGHKIQVYTCEGKLVREIGQRGTAEGEFNFPTYLTLDKEGRLYVADSMNFRIQIFDAEGRFLRAFGEQGDSPGMFSRLKGVALDSFGNVYVVEGEHSAVQIFSPYPDFHPLMWFGGKATMVEYMDIVAPIAIDPRTNRIYVGNNDFARVNVYELVAATPTTSPSPQGAAGAPAP